MGRAGDSQYDDVSGSADPTKLSWLVKDATGTGTATKELLASTLSTLIGGGGGGGGDTLASLRTLSGTSALATNLGTFTGTTIADNQTVKAALQLLETAVESKADYTATVNSLAALSSAIVGLQPLDSDLTAIAALTTTSYGRSFLDRADATAARTLLGLGTLATLSAVGTAQITDANVTLAKLASSGAASVLLGRGAGSGAGVYQELTLGSGLSLSGTVLSASGGGGGTPGGSTTQLQYNNAGAFAGAADVTYSTGQLAVTPAWSGTGTATTPLRVNVTADPGPASAASKLLDLQIATVSKASVTKAGEATFAGWIDAASIRVAGNAVCALGTHLSRVALDVGNGAGFSVTVIGGVYQSANTMVCIGGKTLDFPALKRSTTELQIRLADDSAFADLRMSALTALGAVQFGTHSSLASEVVTGYITIKDAGGTTRKLAVVS